MVDSVSCILDIIDTAGQEEYTAMRDHYFRSGDGFLLVFAADDKKSFTDVRRFRKEIQRAKDSVNTPMVLVGTR